MAQTGIKPTPLELLASSAPCSNQLSSSHWFVCLVLDSDVKIWGKLRKNKGKIFLGRKENQLQKPTLHFLALWRGRREHMDSPPHHLHETNAEFRK